MQRASEQYFEGADLLRASRVICDTRGSVFAIISDFSSFFYMSLRGHARDTGLKMSRGSHSPLPMKCRHIDKFAGVEAGSRSALASHAQKDQAVHVFWPTCIIHRPRAALELCRAARKIPVKHSIVV